MRRILICWIVLVVLLTCMISGAMAASAVVTTGSAVTGRASVSLPVGKTTDLKRVVKEQGLNTKKLTWVSSDEAVVKVKDGTAKGVSIGEATITATATGDVTGNVEISVAVVQPVKKITFTTKEYNLAPGVRTKIGTTVAPENATNREITWSSSNDKVAVVNHNGVVTGIKKGNAKITATAVDGSGVKASVTVKVKEYDLVFTDKSPKEVSYSVSGAGSLRIRGSVKNGNVRIPDITFEVFMIGIHSYSVPVTPVHPGTDTVTIKINSSKLKYTVFVADDFDKEVTIDEKPADV